MFSANWSSPLNALANPSLAPGATSWMSCSTARPSSVPGPFSGPISWSTVTLRGRSPVFTSSAAWIEQPSGFRASGGGHASKLSDSAPTRTPLPVIPRLSTASAFSTATAWLWTRPAFACGLNWARRFRTPGMEAAARADPSGRYPSAKRPSMLLVAVRRNPTAVSSARTVSSATPSSTRSFTTGSPRRLARWSERRSDRLGSPPSQRATICARLPPRPPGAATPAPDAQRISPATVRVAARPICGLKPLLW